MSEWKECRLTEVCDTISETYKDSAKKVVLINTSDVLEGKITNHKFVDNKNLAGQFKKKFQKNDILYSEIRPANKRYAFVDIDPRDYIASTKLMVLRSKSFILPKYLYYLLTNKNTIRELHAIAVGRSGTFPQITYSELSNIKFKLPPIEIQEIILSFLLNLDDKISVNKKICENLEAQAQALFKHWFIDFAPFKDGKFVESELGMIPEGWRVGTLGEIAEVSSGKRPIKRFDTETEEHNVPLIGASCVMGYTNEAFMSKKILLTGRVGTLGVIQRFRSACWPSDNTLVLTTQFYEFVYQILKTLNYSGMNRGTSQPLITQGDLKNTSIIMPPDEIIQEYENVVSKLMSLIEYNNKESKIISTLRDTLLPRLMSGEIKL